MKKHALKANDARWTCPQKVFGAKSSTRLKPLREIVGQDRAVRAIRVGLSVHSPGFNIYVAGMTGTGRMTTIKKLLQQIGTLKAPLRDLCYVHNFSNPECPTVLYLRQGGGRALQRDLENTVHDLQQAIPLVFESEYFRSKAKAIVDTQHKVTRQAFAALEERAKEAGLEIVTVEQQGTSHPELFPFLDGQVVNWEDVHALVQKGKFGKKKYNQLQKAYNTMSEELHQTLNEARKRNLESERKIKRLQQDALSPYVNAAFRDLKSRFEGEDTRSYLESVKQEILSDFSALISREPSGAPEEAEGPEADPLLKFKVNVLVDNEGATRPPVIVEKFPSQRNLFGSIEKTIDRSGILKTDFTRIRAGSLIRANGGYLVLNLSDALMEQGVWTKLKQALKNNQIDVPAGTPEHILTTTSIKPEPIDLDVKIIIVGDSYYYGRLTAWDSEFPDIFKIRADFDTTMTRTDEAVRNYGRFISKICKDEALLPFDASAMSALAEHGVRMAANRDRISTKFSRLADIIREADWWARDAELEKVSRTEVDRALEERIFRNNLYEEKVRDNLRDGRILVAVDGERVGQVNGLTVNSYGYHRFGRPSRITCSVGVGQSGIISIDREADLSGKTHRKGIAIISGYFRGKYGGTRPVNMSVSLTFEQLYGYIDGDSASSTEIYAILSALAGLPVRQDLAVTGSVSQKGEIQPIGGVNEKIEGFFESCTLRGDLTGTQGVIIPRQNVANLMLGVDVVSAIRARKFHIFAISSIDEGIELLTGVKAGAAANGAYPAKSVHGMVEARLRELADAAKGTGNEAAKTNGKVAVTRETQNKDGS